VHQLGESETQGTSRAAPLAPGVSLAVVSVKQSSRGPLNPGYAPLVLEIENVFDLRSLVKQDADAHGHRVWSALTEILADFAGVPAGSAYDNHRREAALSCVNASTGDTSPSSHSSLRASAMNAWAIPSDSSRASPSSASFTLRVSSRARLRSSSDRFDI
jgi:hypothetical protein